jgi:hypothetical protein
MSRARLACNRKRLPPDVTQSSIPIHHINSRLQEDIVFRRFRPHLGDLQLAPDMIAPAADRSAANLIYFASRLRLRLLTFSQE